MGLYEHSPCSMKYQVFRYVGIQGAGVHVC